MPPSPRPYTLVDTPGRLDAALSDLSARPAVSFDLEFDSNLRRYGVTLALIQIATPEHCFLIDPLAGLDLVPLYALLEDGELQKLVHSPGEDLRLLHSLGCFPAAVFDTEIAARLLNYERTSLSAMLEQKLGVVLSGGQQRSNWLQRPLTDAQQEYGAADALHLHRLKALLEAECRAQGLWDFVLDEQAALSAARYNVAPKTGFLKPADLRLLSPWQQHVLQALLRHRDALAREKDVPPFRVGDEAWLRSLVTGDEAPQAGASHRNPALARQYETAADEADGLRLSKTPPPRVRLSPDEHRARALADRDRKEKFAPVQAVIAERYGPFAATFILSNGLVGEIVRGAVTLTSLGKPYRKRVIEETAAGLGISLERYA